uniref:TNFR-Cys domain-containing protein n=1 Tax=Stegastes partitus TaxID=144197 RepID=A0A3B4ZUY2_9TELE
MSSSRFLRAALSDFRLKSRSIFTCGSVLVLQQPDLSTQHVLGSLRSSSSSLRCSCSPSSPLRRRRSPFPPSSTGTLLPGRPSAATPTQCAPCGEDRFTALWNYLPRCLYCSNFCSDNEEVETECSPTTNRVCRCRQGFYRLDDFCVVTPSAIHEVSHIWAKGEAPVRNVCVIRCMC